MFRMQGIADAKIFTFAHETGCIRILSRPPPLPQFLTSSAKLFLSTCLREMDCVDLPPSRAYDFLAGSRSNIFFYGWPTIIRDPVVRPRLGSCRVGEILWSENENLSHRRDGPSEHSSFWACMRTQECALAVDRVYLFADCGNLRSTVDRPGKKARCC